MKILSDDMRENINRFKRGVASHGFAQAVTIFTQVGGLPIFLSRWNIEEYGEWIFLSAIPLYLSIMDFGISAAAGNSMTMLRAAGKYKEANILCDQLIKIMTIVCCLLLLSVPFLFLVGTFFFEKSTLTAFCLLLLLSILTIYCGVYDAIYKSYSMYALVTIYLTLTRVFEWVLCVGFVLMNQGMVGAAGGLLLGRIIGILVIHYHVLDNFKSIDWVLAFKVKVNYSNFFKEGFPFLLFPIGSLIFIQGGVVLCGALLGKDILAIFNTLRTLSRFPTQLSILSAKSLQPEISNLFGRGEKKSAEMMLNKITKKTLIVSIIFSIGIFLCGDFVVNYWSHGKIYYNAECIFLLLVAAVLSGYWQIKSTLLMAVNKGRAIALLYISVAVVFVVASAVMAKPYGLIGVCVVYIVSEFLMLILVNKIVGEVGNVD